MSGQADEAHDLDQEETLPPPGVEPRAQPGSGPLDEEATDVEISSMSTVAPSSTIAATASASSPAAGQAGHAPLEAGARGQAPKASAASASQSQRASSAPPSSRAAAAPSEDLRARAFLTAAALLSGSDALASLHPGPSARLLIAPEAQLGTLLWRELEAREQEVGGAPDFQPEQRGPERYFQRRREDQHRRRWGRVTPRLGQPWRRLVECSSAEARDLCIDIGGRLAACAARGLDARELRRWLAPLEGPSAHRVAAHIVARGGAPQDPLAAASRRLFEDCRAKRRGEAILSLMGRRLLTALLAELPSEDREAAGRVARTNILTVLVQLDPLELGQQEERARAWELIRAALGSEQGAAR